MTNKKKELQKKAKCKNTPSITNDKVDEVATYYGFNLIKTPTIIKKDISDAKILKETEPIGKETGNQNCFCYIEEKIAILRNYFENKMEKLPQPTLIYYKNGICGECRKKTNKPLKQFGLEIIGTPKSVAEAILIKTVWVILQEEGFINLSLEINSIGDKESLSGFNRELTNYYKKNLNNLHSECRHTFKNNIFDILSCKHEKCQPIKEKAPKSINYLSEASRKHFMEVLEYLETIDIPYKINNNLVGKKCCSDTVFAIKNLDDNNTLAIGVRYNPISKKIGLIKKELPSIGVKVSYNPKKTKNVKKVSIKKPKFYFIQLGFEAKLKSLKVVEILRQAKIPIYQSLSKDKLASQIATAENLKIKHIIIMGQKEAKEDSVMVRNMNNRFQETIKIDKLPNYLENIAKQKTA